MLQSNQICRPNKSLYGLKHASKRWNEKLINELIQQGFYRSKLDYKFFFFFFFAKLINKLIQQGFYQSKLDYIYFFLQN